MERLLRKNPKLTESMEKLINKNLTLTTIQKQNRLHFAFANLNTNWDNVVFADEIKFGNVGIWASIHEYGPWKMRFFNGRFSTAEYVSILDDYVLPSFHQKQEMMLMQDQAPVHKSRLVKSWQEDHPEIKISAFPKKSFDFNPMNKVWAIVKERIQYVPRNEMQEEIVQAWRSMKNDPEYFKDIYFGMHSTMADVIDRHGSFLD